MPDPKNTMLNEDKESFLVEWFKKKKEREREQKVTSQQAGNEETECP